MLHQISKIDIAAIFIINVALAGLVSRIIHIIRIWRKTPTRIGW